MNTFFRMNRWTVIAMLTVAFLPFAGAQDDGVYDVNGDVDGDGLVGPTDIQHVINGALGINDRGEDAVRRFMRQYVVASPRAALVPVPQLHTDEDPAADVANDRCDVAGAAHNFPRDHGRIVIRKDGVVVFRYDRNAEGVIYPGACGLLRSELLLEMRPYIPEMDGDEERPMADEVGSDGPDVEPEWTVIGRDGAEVNDCGPLFATGLIAVRHQFERAGTYIVRATISTYAIPAQRTEDPDAALCGAARSVDHVLVGVRVVEPERDEVRDEDLDWEDADRAPEIPTQFGRPLDPRVDTDERVE